MKDGRINFRCFVIEIEGKLFFVQQMKWGVSYCYFFGFVVYYFLEVFDFEVFIVVLFVEYGLYKQYVKKIQIEVKRDFLLGWKIFLIECFRCKMFFEVFSVDFDFCVEVDDVLSVYCEFDGIYKVVVYIVDVLFFLFKNFDLDKVVFFWVVFVYGSIEVFYYNFMFLFYLGKEFCSIFFDKEKLVVFVVFYVNDDGVQLKEFEFYCSIVKFFCKFIYE